MSRSLLAATCSARSASFSAVGISATFAPWTRRAASVSASQGRCSPRPWVDQTAWWGSVIRRLLILIAAFTLAACSPVVPTPPPPTTAPRPTGTPPPSVVTISEPTGIEAYAWSPDGQHLVIDSDGLTVLDVSGKTVASPDGMIATWTDSRHFATWSPLSATSADGSVTVYSLDGSVVTLPGSYSGLALLGDGAGSLALGLPSAVGKNLEDRFVVWQNGVLGDPLPGRPLGWSKDGSTLIVATGQPLAGIGGQSVAIAVLTRPFRASSERPVKSIHLDPTYLPAFNAAGTEVAFPCGGLGELGDCNQLVLDLATGRGQEVASQPAGLPLSWLPDGGLLLANEGATGAGDLREWNGSTLVDAELPKASWGLAASTGAVALVTEAPDATTTTQVVGSTGVLIGQSAGSGVAWSADGSALAIRNDLGDAITILRMPTGK
jgi:hypothetical protein